MKPWKVLGRARAPDETELILTSHDAEYVISAGGQSLMSSRMHASEDALAVIGCRRASTLPRPTVLVGGLGMGFTLRAALDVLPPAAQVVVAELVPEIVEWNRGPLGELAGHPLNDVRVRVQTVDVAVLLRSSTRQFDAVLLDVDNGPTALTTSTNASLYSAPGLIGALAALRPAGVLAVWSAADERGFERRLRSAGVRVSREQVRGASNHRGPRHTILIAHNDTAGQ